MNAPTYWTEACVALAASDPVLARLIENAPACSLRSRGDPFETLLRSVIGQQISVKAADTVWRRVSDAVRPLCPENLLNTEPTVLRACGLSMRKVGYVQDLARRLHTGEVEPGRWHAMDDAALIVELTQIKGIGRWTAEMFMIFHLLRPDVFPVDDLGLQRAVSLHYNAGIRLTRSEIVDIGTAWTPWRSVATWYLWRSLDPVPVEY